MASLGVGNMGFMTDLRTMKQGVLKAVYIIIGIFILSGCEVIKNANLMDTFKREPVRVDSAVISERGFGKLSKGQFLAAQALFDEALKTNPRDVYALFGKGIVLQNSSQLNHARQVFEAILALRPSSDQKLLVINELAPQSIRDLAALNLSLLDSKGVTSAFGPSGKAGAAPVRARIPKSNLRPSINKKASVTGTAGIPSSNTRQDRNIIKRFEILKTLRDQGLVTPVEFAVRRKRNIGALTRLTAPPPAAGLIRSVPSADQISHRLKAISRALELRAITIRQHGAERTMIIDGLMPASPKVSAKPSIRPKGLMAAAAAVRRVEMLKERGLITKEEYKKEKMAIEKILAPPKVQITKKKEKAKPIATKIVATGGPKPALHLASFRSKRSADRAWTQLRRAHKSILGKLKSEVIRINLGRTKGVYYRLIAGPFVSTTAASEACKKLKARRQYCDSAFMS